MDIHSPWFFFTQRPASQHSAQLSDGACPFCLPKSLNMLSTTYCSLCSVCHLKLLLLITTLVLVLSDCVYGGCTSRQTGIDYPGNDLAGDFAVRYVEDCCALCRLRRDCGAWTTSPKPSLRCWLKSAAGTQTSGANTTSGRVDRLVTCCNMTHGT